jgi:hypothetical protein
MDTRTCDDVRRVEAALLTRTRDGDVSGRLRKRRTCREVQQAARHDLQELQCRSGPEEVGKGGEL